MKSKLLSIIIPVYNVEKYIRACLESVYAQNVEIDSFEVIVINDGTRDNSMAVVNEFCQKYNNLIIINQNNKGLSTSRNNGLVMASGDYIWFVDSDDMIVNNCLSYLYNKLNANPDVDAFISNIIKIDEKTYSEFNEKTEKRAGLYLKGKDYLFIKNSPLGPVQRNVLKRSFLIQKNIKFMKDVFHEDGEFGIKMLYQASLIYVLDRPIYKYLIRSNGSIMSSWKRKNSEDLILIYKELEIFRDIYVEKNDLKMFKLINYRILMCSINFAIKNWDTQDFKNFYDANKSFIKQESRKFIHFSEYGVKWALNAIFYSISPIIVFKLKYKFKSIK